MRTVHFQNLAAPVTVAESGFGKRIKEAIEQKHGKLPTQQQAREQAERERKRYKHLRQPTKGE